MNEDDIYSAQYLYNAVIEYVYFVILHAQNKGRVNLKNLEKYVKFFRCEVSRFIGIFDGNDFAEKLGNMLCTTTSIFCVVKNKLQMSNNYNSLKMVIVEDLIVSKVVDLILRGICNIQDIFINLNLNSIISVEEEFLFTLLKKFPFFDILPDSSVMLLQFHGLLGFDNSTYSTVVNYFQSFLQNTNKFTFDEVRLHSTFLPTCGVRSLLMVFCILNHCKIFKTKSGLVYIRKKFKRKSPLNKLFHSEACSKFVFQPLTLKKLVPVGLVIHEVYGHSLQNWTGEVIHLKQSGGFINSVVDFRNCYQDIFTIYFNKAALKYICEINNLKDCLSIRSIVEFDAEFYDKGEDVNIYWIATRVKVIKQTMNCTFAELNSDSIKVTENMYAKLHKPEPAMEKCFLRKPLHDHLLEINQLSYRKELLSDHYMLPIVMCDKTGELSEIHINDTKSESERNTQIEICSSEQTYNLSCDITSHKLEVNSLLFTKEPINKPFTMDRSMVDDNTEKSSEIQVYSAETGNEEIEQVGSLGLEQACSSSCDYIHGHKLEINSFCNKESLNEHHTLAVPEVENNIPGSSESQLNTKFKNKEIAQIESLDMKKSSHLFCDIENTDRKTSFCTTNCDKSNCNLNPIELKLSSDVLSENSPSCDVSHKPSEVHKEMKCDKIESWVLKDFLDVKDITYKYQHLSVSNLMLQNSAFMFGSIMLIMADGGIARTVYKNMNFNVFFKCEAIYPSNSSKSLERGQKLLIFVPYLEYDNSLFVATLIYPLNPTEITISEKSASADDFTVNYFIPSISKNVKDAYNCDLVCISPISCMLKHKEILHDCFNLYIGSSSSIFNYEMYINFQVLFTMLHKKKLGIRTVELNAPIFLRLFRAMLEIKVKILTKKTNKCLSYNKLRCHKKYNNHSQLKSKLTVNPICTSNSPQTDKISVAKENTMNGKIVKNNPLFRVRDILEENSTTLSSYKSCDSIKSSDTFFSCESLPDDIEETTSEKCPSQKYKASPDETLPSEDRNTVSSNIDLEGESLSAVNTSIIPDFLLQNTSVSEYAERKGAKYINKEIYFKLKSVPRFKPRAKKKIFFIEANFRNIQKSLIRTPAYISVITNSCLYLCTKIENCKTVLAFPRKIIPKNMLKFLQVNTIVNVTIIPNIVSNLSEIISMEICNYNNSL